MSKPIIKAANLGKDYRLDISQKHDTLRDFISEIPKTIFRQNPKEKQQKFWAIKNINFEVKEGEVLGLIGRNGAGKSTLLKILARVVTPSQGRATIRGSVASILEVGTGFHPELTGRENVFLNGALLGMKKREIGEKFEKIVEFSEIGKFLDMPVKRYSSGMKVRLAFSVVAHLSSDVLLIDEVLAVGDMAFRAKSLAKMQSMARNQGRTVVFVSHSMTAIDSLCDKTLLLEKGKIVTYGETKDVISEYISQYVSGKPTPLKKVKTRTGNGEIKVLDFWIENNKGKKINLVHTGDACFFVFKYTTSNGKHKKDVNLSFAVKTEMNQHLFLNSMSYTKQNLKSCKPQGKFRFKFDKFPLVKGTYNLSFRVTVQDKEADHVLSGLKFKVENGDFYETGLPVVQGHSPILVNGSWENK